MHRSSEAVPFLYLASVCRSLQCLISALTQVGGVGLLLRFASSVLLWGGRGTADRYRCVWGALPVFRPHWVCPAHGCLCFPRLHCSGSRLSIGIVPCIACGSSFRVLHKSADSVAPAFCAFPGLCGSGSQELEGRTLPGCGEPFPLRGPSLNFCACWLGASSLSLFSGSGL